MTDPGTGNPTLRSWGERFMGLANRRLVLASASPRRAELLRGLNIPHEVRPVSVPEVIAPGEKVENAVVRLAETKARAAAGPGEDDVLVLGADTVVVVEDRILGKPESPGEARRMLQMLSGREHRVLTGIAVHRPPGQFFSGVEETRVWFRVLTGADIDFLVDSGEAMDKAGGYGIQGLGAMVVESLEGDYFNVVGLPLGRLQQLIKQAVNS